MKLDGEIVGNRRLQTRNLVPWQGGEGGDLATWQDDLATWKVGGWDQFQGRQSTYKFETYTTHLQRPSPLLAQLADLIARDVEGGRGTRPCSWCGAPGAFLGEALCSQQRFGRGPESRSCALP
ncbi:unnamed protein product [Symbiodinium sp. CCMP2592]|nr:unnamed protein product [Symbiodinium sp. CCMP2592]